MTELLKNNTIKIYRILIGIAYLAFSRAFDKVLMKFVIAICGLYLILMNFIPDFSWNSIIVIVCILTPMIIGRFLPEEEDDEKIVVE